MDSFIEATWVHQILALSRTGRDSPVYAAQSTPSSPVDYNPFNEHARLALKLAPFGLICIAALFKALPSSHSWLPKRLTAAIAILSPLVTDDDLQQTKIGELSRPTGMLRHGAILDEDADPAQYSTEGFKRQRRRVAIFCIVASVEAAWSIAQLGWQWAAVVGATVLGQASSTLAWITLTLLMWHQAPSKAPIDILVLVVLLFADAAARLLDLVPMLTSGHAGMLTAVVLPAVIDTTVTLALILLIFAMPVKPGGFQAQVPLRERKRLASREIVDETEDLRRDYELCPTTPEDYTSLASSLTYTWMESMQQLSMTRPLLPSDVWRLRSSNDTHILSEKFAHFKNTDNAAAPPSLTKRLLLTNANDIALDMTYKLCAVILAYAGPALMRGILQCISDAAAEQGVMIWSLTSQGFEHSDSQPNIPIETSDAVWTPRSKAFVLALFTLGFTLIRYVAELKNFHHARQVGLRVRSVLVIELFEKALRRRVVGGSKAGELDVQEDTDSDKFSQNERKGGKSAGRRKRSGRDERAEDEQSPLLRSQKASGGAAVSKSNPAKTGEKAEKLAHADVGKLVNMMASDINVLLRLGCDSHQLYGAPLEVIIATVFLYRLLGFAAIAGLSVLILGVPLSYVARRYNVRAHQRWRKATDKRISLVAELLNAIRFVKIQGSQDKWIERIMAARREEMRLLIWARANQLLFVLVWAGLPISSTVLMFYVYVIVQGNALSIPVAFTTITLSTMIRTPLNVIPAFANSIFQAVVSVKRLEDFFREAEVDHTVSSLTTATHEEAPAKVESQPLALTHASFSWKTDGGDRRQSPSNVLEDITLLFPSEGLCVIEGPTASGKSSLLAALLGELQRTGGQQSLPKFDASGKSQISFASQTPWLEAGASVRDNITFVTQYDKVRYEQVVHACALREDMTLLSDGDATRISRETLSGGQKARISLARALYHRSRYVLLDDILSAVDTRVQRHIYEEALTGPISEGRCIIIATHHVPLVLPSTIFLVRLKNGRLYAAGSPDELQERGLGIEASVKDQASSSTSSSTDEASSPDQQRASQPAHITHGNEDAVHKTRTARLLYELEARQVGNIRWKSYAMYLRAAPIPLWLIIFALGLILRAVISSEQYWLKLWGEAYNRPAWNLPPAEGHELFYVAILGVIGFSTLILIAARASITWLSSYIASKRLYRALLDKVVRARMRFFDRNPTGRILQRFNLDIGVVDSELPNNARNFVANVTAFATSAFICIVIVPTFSIPVVLGIIFAIWGIRGFLKTTMYMQRIESTSTSPMYTAFTQILEGLMTVRAYGAEAYFLDRMQTITSITSAQWWAICTIEIWLSFRAQLISGLSVFLATVLALTGAVSPGSAGMVISSSSMLTTIAYNLSHDYKVLSNNGNSVERVKEYIETEQEAPEKIFGLPVPAAWPTNAGGIDVRKLSVNYDDDLPEVLHSISFSINPREKIAIVGRTGSGKTSFVSAFMRAVEPCSPESAIIVDGLNLMKLGLEYRSRISVVPQDPILFSGTIRQNLDPFDEKSDEECQWALDRVGINRELTQGLSDETEQVLESTREPVMLSTEVASGSTNLSAGQAQLVCLARALLRDARIVILDEATSSTDFETDKSIQQAIREMRDSIIIAVAHRLSTVIDYDRILVMSRGNVVEYDTPRNLLSKDIDEEGAHFKKMCKEAGSTTYRQLCEAVGVSP